MGISRRVSTAWAAVMLAGGVLVGVGAGVAQAYGGDGKMDVYQIGVSFNCNNRSFCGAENLGGFWGWAELDHNPATGQNTGDAVFEGCSHGEFKGAGHTTQDISDWWVAAGSAGPRTLFVTGTETDTFRGQSETFPLVGEDTGVNLVPGHQSTTDIFGIQTPPGVAAQIQIAYKPAH